MTHIKVQTEDFDVGAEIAALDGRPHGYRRHRLLRGHRPRGRERGGARRVESPG